MKLLTAVCLLNIGLAVHGQSTQTGSATATGACAVSHSGNYDNITIQNCGIGEEQGKKIIAILNAITKGQDYEDSKLDQILTILSTPIKINKSESFPVPSPSGSPPRAAMKFSTEDPVDRGQFEITCDRACAPVEICTLEGTNVAYLATVSDDPNAAEFLFQRQFPAFTECELVVESRDEKPVKILNITTSRRVTDLVPNAIQPHHFVIAGHAGMGAL